MTRVVASRAKRRWPWRDFDDMAHDALWGLYKAWETWRGPSEFRPYAEAYCWWAVKRGLRKQADRENIAGFTSLEEKLYRSSSDGDGDPTLVDVLPDQVCLEDIVLARLEITAVLAALKHEQPVVVDAVLANGSDAEIARRHGLRDGGSIRQYRRRFLRDYILGTQPGAAFESTGRKRLPAGPKKLLDTVAR